MNRSGLLNTTASSLSDLIKFAYDVHPRQIIGGPAWLESEKFDITGKPDTPGIPNGPQLKKMVQKLLTDRFQLTFHHETKELSVYAITVAKTGVKMTRNDTSGVALPGFGGAGRTALQVRNATMTEFAHFMQAQMLDRPVVDQTSLGSVRYDFMLRWTPEGGQSQLGGPGANAPAPGPDSPDAPPDLFLAFQQQLGLKLDSTKAPVEVLAIDKVEKPSEN